MQEVRELLKQYNRGVAPEQQVKLAGEGVTLEVLQRRARELGLKVSESTKKVSPKGEVGPVLFFGHFEKSGPYHGLSNWARAEFDDAEGNHYVSTEQKVMADKAELFKDAAMARTIREEIVSSQVSDSAWKEAMKRIKADGRKVGNFDQKVWEEHRVEIMRQALLLKFRQNQALREVLLSTGNRRIAEAAPRDKVWGIGMGKDNPLAQDPANWKGTNLLGESLEWVRTELRRE